MKPSLMDLYIEFEKAVARMEIRGIPFDIANWKRIEKARAAILRRMKEDINAVHPVFIDGSFSKRAFFEWVHHNKIAWPVTISPTTGHAYYPLNADTFKDMETRHPFIAELREVLKTIKTFGPRSIVVDPVLGRHFFDSNIFRAVTGRNQPRGFVFAGPKWMRFLIVSEDGDHVLIYCDFSGQEIGLAAALSGDLAMRKMYEDDDPHMAFAIRAGAAPVGATKKTHSAIRKIYKTTNLGVLYGQSAFGIAKRLGISQAEASVILAAHKELFSTFWQWSERIVQGSFDRGWIVTPCGWRSRVLPGDNERTWMNWPMQAAGGDIMRLTMIYLDRQNVQLLAPVHDGFLLTCRREQLPDLRAAVDYACRMATEHVVPGFPLRWDVEVHEHRYVDEDGLPMWQKLQGILAEIGDE